LAMPPWGGLMLAEGGGGSQPGRGRTLASSRHTSGGLRWSGAVAGGAWGLYLCPGLGAILEARIRGRAKGLGTGEGAGALLHGIRGRADGDGWVFGQVLLGAGG